jgi:hypothetical protein
MFYKQRPRTKPFLSQQQLREMRERLMQNYELSLEEPPNPTNIRQAMQDIRDLLERVAELQSECRQWEGFAGNVYKLSMRYANDLAALISEPELGQMETHSESDRNHGRSPFRIDRISKLSARNTC